MRTITYKERLYYNIYNTTYGSSITLPYVKYVYMILSICIPIVVPVWLIVFIPNKIVVRY